MSIRDSRSMYSLNDNLEDELSTHRKLSMVRRLFEYRVEVNDRFLEEFQSDSEEIFDRFRGKSLDSERE